MRTPCSDFATVNAFAAIGSVDKILFLWCKHSSDMSRKVCTPFCSDKKPCVKHHELLVALLNCADNRSTVRHSTDQLEETVVRYVNQGWNKDDDVEDPIELFRFPLVHWASVLGKCTALEWMLHNGFQPTIRSKSKETAMHRCIMCLYRAGIRRPEHKMNRIVELLKDCLTLKDEDGDTPLHLAAKRLVRGSKLDYFGQALDIMIQQARVMPGKTALIIDCSNRDGNTIAHIVAQNDICVSTVRKLLESGTDLTITNLEKQTPLDVAINSGSRRIAKSMNDHILKAKTPQQPFDSNTFTTDSPPESDSEIGDESGIPPAAEEESASTDHGNNAAQEAGGNTEGETERENSETSGENSHPPQEAMPLIPPDQIKKETTFGECPSCRGLCSHAHSETDGADNPPQAVSDAPNMDSSLLNFLKGAGLLENVAKLANDTRLGDANLLKEKLEAVQEMNDTIASIDNEIEKKKETLDQLSADLERLSSQKEREHGKRKRLNEECSELQSKLHCCDSLLRCVPKTKIVK